MVEQRTVEYCEPRALVVAEARMVEGVPFPADGPGGGWDEALVRAWIREHVPLGSFRDHSKSITVLYLDFRTCHVRCEITDRDLALRTKADPWSARPAVNAMDALVAEAFELLVGELSGLLKKEFDAR